MAIDIAISGAIVEKSAGRTAWPSIFTPPPCPPGCNSSAVSRLIDKAETSCGEGFEPVNVVDARLTDDMLPFGYQVKSCVGHSLGALEGVRAGRFSPDTAAWPTDCAGLKGKVDAAIAALEGVDQAEVNALTGRDMAFVLGEMRMDFTAEDFLLSFSMPNFYFHASIAYALLRARGVQLGKRDFLGRPRLKG